MSAINSKSNAPFYENVISIGIAIVFDDVLPKPVQFRWLLFMQNIKCLFILGIILTGQMQFIHAGDKMENLSKEEKQLCVSMNNAENMLILLDADEYTIAKSFFHDFKINQPILYSILENRSAGKIFTDDRSNPSFMLVCSPAAYVFLGGSPDQTSLRKIVSYLKSLLHVSLVSPVDWKFKTFFEEAGFTAVERLQFQRHCDFFNLDSWKDSLPARYSINKIDNETFPQCNWRSFILSCYGDADHFFTNGRGFCLVDQGKIISEAYGIIAAGKAEIGVVTDEKYRGQNLGTSICAVMLDYCCKNDIEPFWSCNANNPASVAIAKKLGFEESCKYFFLKWATP